MEPKRYIAKEDKLICPYCNRIVNDKPLVNGGCYRCGGLINEDLSPKGKNCDNIDCSDNDFIIGCRADKFCEDRFLIEEP